MVLNKFITKMLKLSFLKVTWVKFKNRNQELHLGVKPRMAAAVLIVDAAVRYLDA